MESLRLKAEAFSNAGWSEYWVTHGPSLLASGWLAVHPHVPLERLRRVCALHCLTQAMDMLALEGGTTGDHMTGNGDHMTGGGDHVTVSGDHMTGNGDHVTGNGDHMTAEELLNQHQDTVMSGGEEMVTSGPADDGGPNRNGETIDAPGMPISTSVSSEGVVDPSPLPSDESIAALWGEHYNSYYWYCYHWYCSQTEWAEEEGGAGGIPMEDFSAEVLVGEEREVGNGDSGDMGNGAGGEAVLEEGGGGGGEGGDGGSTSNGGNGEGVLEEGGGDGGGMSNGGNGEAVLEGGGECGELEREVVRGMVEEVVQQAVGETVQLVLGQEEGGMECELPTTRVGETPHKERDKEAEIRR